MKTIFWLEDRGVQTNYNTVGSFVKETMQTWAKACGAGLERRGILTRVGGWPGKGH